jgi:hypothetical protein
MIDVLLVISFHHGVGDVRHQALIRTVTNWTIRHPILRQICQLDQQLIVEFTRGVAPQNFLQKTDWPSFFLAV